MSDVLPFQDFLLALPPLLFSRLGLERYIA